MRGNEERARELEALAPHEIQGLMDCARLLAEARDSGAEVPAGTATPAAVLVRMQWLAAQALAGSREAVADLRRWLSYFDQDVEESGRTAEVVSALGLVPANEAGVAQVTLSDLESFDPAPWVLFMRTLGARLVAILERLARCWPAPPYPRRPSGPVVRACPLAVATPYSPNGPPARTAASPSGARLVQAA